jgi:hypothetical protein
MTPTIIEIRPFRNGWKVFEAPGVEPNGMSFGHQYRPAGSQDDVHGAAATFFFSDGLTVLNDLHSIPISREHLRKTGHLGDGCRVGRLGSSRRREKTNSAKQPEKDGGIGRFRPRFNHVTDISNAPRFAEQAREPDDQESCSRFFEIARGARASRSRHSQLSSRVVERNDALDVATRIENPNLT